MEEETKFNKCLGEIDMNRSLIIMLVFIISYSSIYGLNYITLKQEWRFHSCHQFLNEMGNVISSLNNEHSFDSI